MRGLLSLRVDAEGEFLCIKVKEKGFLAEQVGSAASEALRADDNLNLLTVSSRKENSSSTSCSSGTPPRPTVASGEAGDLSRPHMPSGRSPCRDCCRCCSGGRPPESPDAPALGREEAPCGSLGLLPLTERK